MSVNHAVSYSDICVVMFSHMGERERDAQDSGGETCKKETIGETQTQMGG
jgi:hypothetical protein